MRRNLAALLWIGLALPLAGCGQYRAMRPEEVPIPNYEPREVLIPEKCEVLIRRAATEGMERFNETEAREVAFCQHQHVIRAQEEEAAAKKLEAHAETARFALSLTVATVTALVAVLSWMF